ncbi:MAG: chromate transporter [Lachnospiraceae bacterium]|nr:chromate transporter [Lachnospiraceae bacterium]MCI9283260.1 chromate transporter [Lachnospiraceae bacterium]
MIYISLFLVFLKIGMFAFGGAYGAIPLIQESVLAHGWMDEAMFSNMIAVSESTPGPIMVNAATYIGHSQAGIAGAAVATLGVVLPSFLIILLVTALFRGCLNQRRIQAVLKGVKPCLMGVIFAIGIFMIVKNIFPEGEGNSLDIMAMAVLAVLAVVSILGKRIKKQEISPVVLIIIAGVAGSLLYGV